MSDHVLGLVVGRAGSVGLPNKNILPLAGRRVVEWTFLHARTATSLDRLALSSDCPVMLASAEAHDVVGVERPPALAGATSSLGGAVLHAVRALDTTASVVVVLYANVPIRPDGLIDTAVARLRETGADSVQSYAPVGKHHPAWMVRIDDERRVHPFLPGPSIDRRQDLPPCALPDGGVIAVRRACIEAAEHAADVHAWLGRDRRAVPTARGAVIDIDEDLDLDVAAARLRRAGAPA